ncbi:MAG: preprotein translocase subunit SecG [Candidatus Avilachnospira sp.]
MKELLTVLVSIIYVILGVAIAAIILMQEGNTQGLGSIGGMADSYWGKIKGRSMEGNLEKFTKYGAVVFLILALVLDILMK